MFGFLLVHQKWLDEELEKARVEARNVCQHDIDMLRMQSDAATATVNEYAQRIEHLEKQGQDTWNKWREAVSDKAAAQELMALAHCAREPFSADRVASTFVNADEKDWLKVILQLVHGHRERALARSADTPEQRIAGMMALDDLKRDLLTRVKMANAERAG